ncbi:MAG: spore cortex biosynthesis protein YabQ [Tepidanaerobacteraceae bacterium]|nr:spore cortex biosynthesis protein YabQ [Tepidanaerobacteraceae bacterium]
MGLWDIGPQVVVLIVAFAIGLVTGLLFDVYRRLRNLISPGPFITALGDLCFWMIITVITFASYMKISSGQVRGYMFFGIAIGLFLYLYYISRYVIIIFVSLHIYINRCFKMLLPFLGRIKRLKLLLLPRRIWRDFRRVFSKIRKK